jgi:hypothetical protein
LLKQRGTSGRFFLKTVKVQKGLFSSRMSMEWLALEYARVHIRKHQGARCVCDSVSVSVRV